MLFGLSVRKNNKKLAALKELARRNRLKNIDFRAGSFDAQIKFLEDTSKRKAALTNRRAGKSTSAALIIFDKLTKNPRTHAVYAGLTAKTARTVVWDALKDIDKKFELNSKFYNRYHQAIVLENGSTLSFFGLDDNEKEKEKILGQKLILFVLDEGSSYTIDLEEAIRKHIAPTLIDLNGQLIIIGTPGNNRNYFCEITEGRVPGWSVHQWSALDNPYMRDNYLAEINDLKQKYPNIEENPAYQQHYLGKWTIDLDATAYKYTDKKNKIDKLPEDKEYQYMLSIDLGWEDANAFVISAWSYVDKYFYIVETFSKPKMYLDDIITKIRDYESKYKINKYLIDSANKQYVEELKKRSSIPFVAAAKSDKMNYVYMMNSDLILGKIKIISDQCKSLVKEYETLTINKENPVKPYIVGGDHNADAALYAWRQAYNYLSKEIVITKKTDEDKVNDFWAKEENRILNKNNNTFLEDDFG